jgi:hypothetical protein
VIQTSQTKDAYNKTTNMIDYEVEVLVSYQHFYLRDGVFYSHVPVISYYKRLPQRNEYFKTTQLILLKIYNHILGLHTKFQL